jgi:protocatechuate 3,4-dioxygenase beta subunit
VGLRKIIGSTPFVEPFQKGTTDQDGNYRITNVAPGTYDVVPSAPAYVVTDGNAGRGKNVVVGEDEEVEGINFSLVRGGVITGKVTDADGRPVIQQQVFLYRAGDFLQQQAQQLRQVYPANSGLTDDRGIYRFFGLVAGQYKVAAGRGEGITAGTFGGGRFMYKQVFHPDKPDVAQAPIIEVREGSEAGNIDIALGRAMQTFSASGRVIYSETQLPVPNIRFGLQRYSGQRYEGVESFASSNGQGDFFIEGLAPGKYGVFLYPNQNPELRAEAVMFDVFDQDVTALTIRLVRGSSISGVIVFEHEDKKAFATLLQLYLGGQISGPTGSSPMLQSALSPIASDGSFRLAGLSAGAVNFRLSRPTGASPPKGFFISRIEHNGLTLRQGLQINDGDNLIGVRVFVGYGSASIRGVVNVDRGLVPEGARMFARLIKAGQPTNTVATAMVDARGHFLMEGIPAGVYEVSVSLSAPGTRPQIAKEQVTAQDGVVSDVSLTFELTQPRP